MTVKIKPAACCLLGLHWELSFADLSLQTILNALLTMGFSDESRIPNMHSFRHSNGVRIMVVPESKRIQLRLDFETPKAERTATALATAQWIKASASSARRNTPSHL